MLVVDAADPKVLAALRAVGEAPQIETEELVDGAREHRKTAPGGLGPVQKIVCVADDLDAGEHGRHERRISAAGQSLVGTGLQTAVGGSANLEAAGERCIERGGGHAPLLLGVAAHELLV